MTSKQSSENQGGGGVSGNDSADILRVCPSADSPASGHLAWHGRRYRCALGTRGVIAAPDKCEGDGYTPAGLFALETLYFRPDRVSPPETRLPVRALTAQCGWCDDPAAAEYNRYITLSGASRAEALWRDDHAYDIMITLSHNRHPARANRGSAIFLHVAQDDYSPTRGCVAVALNDLLEIAAGLSPAAMIRIYA